MLRDGAIDVIGSDHCTIDRQGKEVDDIARVIPGIPGLDLFLPLLVDLIATAGLTWSALAAATAARPARLFRLPAKGTIEVGKDADMAFVDPDRRWVVRAANLPSSAGWSPYEGRTLTGAVTETWSRGVVVARDGQPIGRPGHGRFIARAA
jgi:dihydroorotase-like cyclic amidohydrolase